MMSMRIHGAGGSTAAVVLGVALAAAPAIPTLAAPPRAASAGDARIEFFAPEGSSKPVRQVTARFNQPMVALGDPRLADPFDIDCPAAGRGRWADGRNWVYDFGADLEAGVRCHFTLKAEVKTLAGMSIGGRRVFSFDTGGPSVLRAFPYEGWSELDENQIFLLKLDGIATPESIRANAWCIAEGVSERIPLEVLTGRDRAAMLAQRSELGYAYYQLLWKSGEESAARVRDRTLERGEASIAVVQCQRRFAPAMRVVVVWGKGIAAASGIATSQDQRLSYQVRPAFTVQVECSRTNARAGCIPMLPVTLRFSSLVPRASALAARLSAKDGTVYVPQQPQTDQEPSLQVVTFSGPFPDAGTLRVSLPADLKDDAGRPLENAARFPLDLAVDEYPPLAKFSGEFGILEANEGGVLPVTLRNVEAELPARRTGIPGRVMRLDEDPSAIASWLQRVDKAAQSSGDWVEDPVEKRPVWRETTGSKSILQDSDSTQAFTLAKPLGSRPSEVVGIPLKAAGFYVVELESRALGASLLGRDEPRYVSTAALVTNVAVHFKWGRESSRVWVTSLDAGKPIADAGIQINNYCTGGKLWSGKTDRDGIAVVGESLGEPHSSSGCYQWSPAPLIVTARTPGDFSFALSGWSRGIGPGDFGLATGSKWSASIFHTVLDRPLLRAGETVSMKHFLRLHTLAGVEVLAGMPAMRKVTVAHLGSGQTYELTAVFDADGVAENRWVIPMEAKLGDYSIAIEEPGHGPRPSGQFKVAQYRLPSMRASVQGPVRPQVNPRDVALDLQVSYLSGGGASQLPVTLRTVVDPSPLEFPGYEDFDFSSAPVEEGIVESSGGRFDYDFEGDAETSDDGDAAPATMSKAQVLPLTLDGEGAARVTIAKLPTLTGPAQLTAELEYADANGELLTSAGRVRLVPSAVSLGIRREGWVASARQLRFRVVVLNLDGVPLARQPVSVALYQRTAYSYRKRLIGGFYAYDTVRETRKLTTECNGTSNAQGLVVCEVAPGVAGEIVLRAQAHDANGNLAGATSSIWVAGADEWWFGGTSGDRMDVIPEKKEYESGEKARFQVRMPFRTATALVTVEREGVLESFVTRLSGRAPVIEVPVGDRFSPNVYVSVLAVRGRVARSERSSAERKADPDITALVDLNKPAYRVGLAEIRVGWKPHRLDVRVTPDQPSYRVRGKAIVHIQVTRADGSALPTGTEVAVAAVDEALLQLAGNPSWNLLEAMMGRRGLEVSTATAQMQVVGKRHYGRKSVPHGGGGGREPSRELFDSLLLWQGRVLVDANGSATLAIPLNDSLSSFRVVAVAHAGAQLYGTGAASIATTQDVSLLSGLPPLVREGDHFAATFTLRNTTARELSVIVSAMPSVAATLSAPANRARTVSLRAGQAQSIVWPAVVPVDAAQIVWTVTAHDSAGALLDSLKVPQTVIPAFPVRTYQATIAQVIAPISVPAERPRAAIAGRGGLEVSLRPKLADGSEGIRDYMKFYPYICLEQNLSRAVALRDRGLWDAWMARLPAYADRDGLLRYFPSEWLDGEDTLTAYALAIAAEAGWEIPDDRRQRLIQALTGFVAGRVVRRSALPTADLAIRKLAAIDALSRYGAATPGMLDSITLEPNLWPTSALIDWLGILERVPGIVKADEKRAVAFNALRARLNLQGTTLGFSTGRTDALWWLMISEDSNAVRLLIEVLDQPAWREDVPRLVRGALGRQQEGHWNTTVANAWGVLALEKFSAKFEKTPVTGKSAVQYGPTQRLIGWPQPKNAMTLSFPWSEERASLDVRHDGTGSPWLMVRATAALPLDTPLSTGFKIKRSVVPVTQLVAGRWSAGDVARVRLELEAQSDMSWVVVDDPVPAGSTILGNGLGGQSQLATRGEKREGWVWPAFEERRFEAFRSYYRFVPKGSWVVEYSLRLNNPGEFLLPATRVEAMYAPEMLGEIPNDPVTVVARP